MKKQNIEMKPNYSELWEIAEEISGISSILTSIMVCIENAANGGDALTTETTTNAIFGVTRHLERLHDNIYDFTEKNMEATPSCN